MHCVRVGNSLSLGNNTGKNNFQGPSKQRLLFYGVHENDKIMHVLKPNFDFLHFCLRQGKHHSVENFQQRDLQNLQCLLTYLLPMTETI